MGAVKSSVLACAALGLLLVPTALAADLYVPSQYPTIQAAINAATDGDTIHVAAGTYNESVTISKSVRLLGPQANVDPRPSAGGRAGPEAVVTFNGTVFDIKAHNVEINGFRIVGTFSSSTTNIVQDNDPSFTSQSAQVRYNIITSTGTTMNEAVKIRVGQSPLVAYNYIHDIPGPGDAINFDRVANGRIENNEIVRTSSENAAIYVYDSTNTEILGNIVDTTSQNDGIKLGAKNGTDATKTGGRIAYNTVRNTAQDGITVYMSNTVVEYNSVTGSNSENGAIYLAFGIANITIENNHVLNNALRTNKFSDAAGIMIGSAVNAATVTLRRNRLEGNTPYGVTNKATAQLDARRNWWGDPTGPYHPTINPGGLGDRISDNVLYDPWYADEAMTRLSSHNPVYNETQGTFHLTIQAAVNAANPGDVIYASPGTYNENVTVNKAGLRIYTNPGAILEGPGTGNGFLIQAANVTIEGFEIRKFAIGIRTYGGPSDYGNLTVRGCYIHVNQIGVQIVYDGFTTVTIEDCQITGNTQEGMSVIDHVPYSKQVATLRILDSNISNNGRHGLMFVRTKVNTVDIQNSHFEGSTNSGYSGISFVVSACQIGTFTMLGGSLSGNKGCGLSVVQAAHTFGSITLDGVEVKNNSESGVMLGGGATCTGNLLVQSCTFSGNGWEDFDLSGGWFGSFGVGGTTTFRFNTFGAGPAWLAIYIGNNGSFTGDVKVNCNNFTAGRSGIQNNTTKQVDATCNWWGAVTGGAWVSGPVTTVPRLVQPYPSCIASGSGDANLDGVVNILDVELVYKAALGLVTLTSAQAAAADVDGVPGISLADAQAIARALITCPWELPTCPCCP